MLRKLVGNSCVLSQKKLRFLLEEEPQNNWTGFYTGVQEEILVLCPKMKFLQLVLYGYLISALVLEEGNIEHLEGTSKNHGQWFLKWSVSAYLGSPQKQFVPKWEEDFELRK
jgi:hypothetical protein